MNLRMMSALAQLRSNRPGSPDSPVFLAAVGAFPESLAIVASGLMVYVNPAWCGMFECQDASQLQGRPLEDLVPGGSFSAGPRTPSNHEGGNAMRFVRTCKDGTCLHIEITGADFHLRGTEFQVVHARDVGRQNQAERQLREAQRMEAVGRLVGGVAHDFNNLLTGIMLYCDLLIGELEKGSSSLRHAQEMRLAGEHGAALVQQLLAVARPATEQPRVFALNEAVTEIRDLLTRLIGENIRLSTSLAADLGAVKMDSAQVQQILLNLVLNARDAMPEGGGITLATRNCAGHFPGRESQITPGVELTVTDTGCGMDAETLDRAFEPFFTTKMPGRGNGLGLATARRLVRQQGGTIMAESEPGRGTTVSVRLPQVQPDTPIKFECREVTS